MSVGSTMTTLAEAAAKRRGERRCEKTGYDQPNVVGGSSGLLRLMPPPSRKGQSTAAPLSTPHARSPASLDATRSLAPLSTPHARSPASLDATRSLAPLSTPHARSPASLDATRSLAGLSRRHTLARPSLRQQHQRAPTSPSGSHLRRPRLTASCHPKTRHPTRLAPRRPGTCTCTCQSGPCSTCASSKCRPRR